LKKLFFDKSTKLLICSDFDKHINGPTYDIYFNSKTGVEVLKEKDGFPEPFSLEFPSLLDIGIMGACPNDCSFCYQGSFKEPNMKLEHFKLLVDQIKDQTMQVALGGRGDPNKHENFKEIVQYCRDNNIAPSYTTSGNNLTDEEVENSKICGAVAVSNYDKPFTYTALKKFMDAGVKTNIHFVLTRSTIIDAYKILSGEDVWNNQIDLTRLNAIVFLLFKPQGKGKVLPHLSPTFDQLRKFSEMFIRSKTKFKVGADSCTVNYVQSTIKIEGFLKNCLDSCEGARMSCYVSPSMKFYPCSFCDPEKYNLSLLEKPLEYYWKADQFSSFRNKIKERPTRCPVGF